MPLPTPAAALRRERPEREQTEEDHQSNRRTMAVERADSLASPCLFLTVAAVFSVGDVGAPVRAPLGERQVGHEVVRRSTVPVLLAVGRVDHVTRVQFHRTITSRLHQPPAFVDLQRLTAVVPVPGGAGSRAEVHGADVEM